MRILFHGMRIAFPVPMPPVLLRRFMERETRKPRKNNPYETGAKTPGPVQCKICKSVNARAKWMDVSEYRHADRNQNLRQVICPACRQKKDKYALGVVELHGNTWKEKSEQILQTVRKTEKIARKRNNQQRILWIQDYRGGLKIYVSLPDLAQKLGRILERSFKGKTEYRKTHEEPYVRATWYPPLPREK